MKVGAEPKKVAFLAVLGVVLVYFLYSNVFATGDTPKPRPKAQPAAAAQPDPADTAPAPTTEVRSRPPLRPGPAPQVRFGASTKDKKIDPATVDPTLQLDRLAKLQNVILQGGDRNLFQFASAPAPPVPQVKVMPKPIAPNPAPPPVAATPAAPPAPPPPPPIPLKCYGYAARAGLKRAFFLDGEEIVVATEGSLIKNRYKVIKIGLNSVTMEDTQFKNQQTLRIEEQAG